MNIISILILFPIIVSPYNESKPVIEKRNSGYIIVYEMEGGKIYGADLNSDGTLIDTFKISQPLWDGDLKIPCIAKLYNSDTFFVAYQYTPHMPSSDTVYYSILGRNIFYTDTLSLGPEQILYEGYEGPFWSEGYENPVIRGGTSGFLLITLRVTDPLTFSSIYSFRNSTGNIIHADTFLGNGIYSADADSLNFYIFDHEIYLSGDTIFLFKFDHTGNILDSSFLYDTAGPSPGFLLPGLQEENGYLACAFPSNSSLVIYFFHTIDTLKEIYNTGLSYDIQFKLLSNHEYFYLFIVKEDTLKGQRFLLSGVPEDTFPRIIYIEDSPIQSIDGIWNGNNFFIVYEKNDDIYGLFVDSSLVNIRENEYSKKYFKTDLKTFILKSMDKYIIKKDVLIYSLSGIKLRKKFISPGIYIVNEKGKKSKIILLK